MPGILPQPVLASVRNYIYSGIRMVRFDSMGSIYIVTLCDYQAKTLTTASSRKMRKRVGDS